MRRLPGGSTREHPGGTQQNREHDRDNDQNRNITSAFLGFTFEHAPSPLEAFYPTLLRSWGGLRRWEAFDVSGDFADILRISTVGLHGALDCRTCSLEILGNHGWRTFDSGVECQEPWLRDCGNLRSIFHVDDKDSSPLAAISDEVSSLWFLFFKNLPNGLKSILLGGLIASLNGERDLEKKPQCVTLLMFPAIIALSLAVSIAAGALLRSCILVRCKGGIAYCPAKTISLR